MRVLVRRAQKGSADCFIRLMEENKQTLMRVAYGFFQNEEDVADAVAQTVADAYEHIRELKSRNILRHGLFGFSLTTVTACTMRTGKRQG